MFRLTKLTVVTLLAALTPMIMATPPMAPRAFAATTGCSSRADCAQAMLTMLNQDRAKRGVAALTLNTRQSHGSGSCVGSIGHSQAMQQSGSTWHSNSSYRAASFPNDICLSFTRAGENVGEASSSDELTDLQQLNTMMMAEAHDTAACLTTISHACNIINPQFHRVGIGIVHTNSVTWLTEDFAS